MSLLERTSLPKTGSVILPLLGYLREDFCAYIVVGKDPLGFTIRSSFYQIVIYIYPPFCHAKDRPASSTLLPCSHRYFIPTLLVQDSNFSSFSGLLVLR